MKLSIRLTTIAITAVAFTGILGAQQRSSSHSAARAQARPQARQQVRQQARQQARVEARPQLRQQMAARGPSERFARENVRTQRYAAPRADVRVRNDVQVRNDFRGREVYRPAAMADHGRPLITRGGVVDPRAYGRPAFGGVHFGAGFNRWGGRLVLPVGWGSRVIFGGFFPASYASYCEAVPVDYDYLLPPMAPSYDPCLFGDRIVVYNRFSRSIVFTAAL